jgi:hypothetical protein
MKSRLEDGAASVAAAPKVEKLQLSDNFSCFHCGIRLMIYRPGTVIVNVNRRSQDRRRILAALVCLLAVAFLYAPFAAAAWSSHAMACCTDGFCNIPKHHHKKAPAHSTASEDCDHAMGGMMDCSMSCCQDPDRPAVTSMAFVLPPVTFAFSAMGVTGAVERVHLLEIPRTIAPLSPPPRIDNAAR